MDRAVEASIWKFKPGALETRDPSKLRSDRQVPPGTRPMGWGPESLDFSLWNSLPPNPLPNFVLECAPSSGDSKSRLQCRLKRPNWPEGVPPSRIPSGERQIALFFPSSLGNPHLRFGQSFANHSGKARRIPWPIERHRLPEPDIGFPAQHLE